MGTLPNSYSEGLGRLWRFRLCGMVPGMSEPLDLSPIKARLAAATPGPWMRDIQDMGPNYVGACLYPHGIPNTEVIYPEDAREEDIDLIANAPQDLAALVAEVERLRGEVEGMWDEILDYAARLSGEFRHTDEV
jgi:hypothetical protein